MMGKKNFNTIFHPVLLSLLLILPQLSTGQTTKTYTGALRIGEHLGNANFQYRIAKQDTILNGLFQIKGSNIDSVLAGRVDYFDVNGKYEDNIPDGEWRIQLGDFSSGGESSLENYQLELKVNGLLQEIIIEIDQGVLIDKQYWVYEIEQSTISDVNFISRLISHKDTTKGELSIANDSIDLCGYVTESGYADGEWIVSSMSSGELYNLQFNDGWLRSLGRQRWHHPPIVMDLFDEDISKSKAIRLSTKYLYVLNLLQLLKEQPAPPIAEMATLISQNESFEGLTDNLLLKLGVVEDKSDVKVFLPHYPLDKTEESHLTAIAQKLRQADSLLNHLRLSASLEILKQADEAVLSYVDEMEKIKKTFIEPYRKLGELNEEGILEFLPRSSLMNIFLGDSVLVELEASLANYGEMFAIPELDKLDQSAKGLDGINDQIGVVVLCLDSLKRAIDIKLQNYERDQELLAMETELMLRQKSFLSLVDTAINETEKPYQALILNIKDSVREEIGEYWKIDNSVVKMLRIEAFQKCIGNMERLVRLVAGLSARHRAIEEAYTVEIWNTFTATTMKEITKKRIYGAYFDVVLPNFINKINDELSCDNAPGIIDLFNKVHLRMFELRQENTRDVEADLRNGSGFREIMTILNMHAK